MPPPVRSLNAMPLIAAFGHLEGLAWQRVLAAGISGKCTPYQPHGLSKWVLLALCSNVEPQLAVALMPGYLLLPQLLNTSCGYPLHAAILSDTQRKEKVEYLLTKLPPAVELQQQFSWDGLNALQLAVSIAAADIIRPLVEAGFDINLPSVLYVNEDKLQKKVRHIYDRTTRVCSCACCKPPVLTMYASWRKLLPYGSACVIIWHSNGSG